MKGPIILKDCQVVTENGLVSNATEKAGAQPLNYVTLPDIELFKRWQNKSESLIKIVTFAPEQENGWEFLIYLVNQHLIPSIGHSNSSYEEVHKAIKFGAKHVTHLYNAMSGLHHREPGLASAALLHNELKVEIIADGFHIHPKIIELTFQTKGSDNIILITDSIRAKNLPPGNYDFVGQQIEVANGKATLLDGTLAGSLLSMEQALQNMAQFTSASIQELVRMTSTNAAKSLNIFHRKGSISQGKDADLVILNQKLEVMMTSCKGELAYEKSS